MKVNGTRGQNNVVSIPKIHLTGENKPDSNPGPFYEKQQRYRTCVHSARKEQPLGKNRPIRKVNS